MTSIPSGGTLLGAAKALDARQVEDATLADLQGLQAALGGLGGNLLVNGGRRIVQRGAGPFTADNAYTADRWMISLAGGSTVSVVADASASPPARTERYEVVVYTHAPGGRATLEQLVEWWPLCKGEAMAYSAWVWASVPNMARIALSDGLVVTFSNYHPGDSLWHRLDVAGVVSPAATTLKPCLWLTGASGTASTTGDMMVFGGQPVDYAPRPYALERLLCERYYEVHGGAAGWPYVNGYAPGAAFDWWTAIPFRVKKGGTPTVTKAGTWEVVNCGQPSVEYVTAEAYFLHIVSVAAGYMASRPNSADDLIAAQWDPS